MAVEFCVAGVKFYGVTVNLPDYQRLAWGAYAEFDGWCLFASAFNTPKEACADIVKQARSKGASIDRRQRNRIFRYMLRHVDLERLRAKVSVRSYGFRLNEDDSIDVERSAWTWAKSDV
jgi:hypothetical protein